VKYEEVYLRDYQTPPEARLGLNRYFEFYNHERPHQSLDGWTPAERYGLRPAPWAIETKVKKRESRPVLPPRRSPFGLTTRRHNRRRRVRATAFSPEMLD
jgi:hypothetical protein